MKKLLLIIANILIIPPVAMYSYYTFSPAKQTLDDLSSNTASTQKILGATDEQEQIYFTVNIPATFKQDISAPNIVYSVNGESGEIEIDNTLKAGSGISIDGREISNTGILTLTAGTGISVDGNKVTNSGITSLSAGTGISVSGNEITNTGITSLSAGTNISIDGNEISNTYSVDLTESGWTDNGTSIVLTTTTDTVAVNTLTTGGITASSLTADGITMTNGNSILPDTDLGSDLGSSSLRFNNLWVANINSNSSQSFSGQTTFSYAPTNTTVSEASVIINPTTSAANGQLLGLAIAGYQKALIDEDGDIILGYSDATSAPASDYPLNVYGHSGTRVAFVDTSGDGYFAGNVGIGTSSPDQLFHVKNTSSTAKIHLDSNGTAIVILDSNDTIWNLNGNATSFTISDATNATTPFVIEENASSNSLYIDSSGNIGMGTTSPTSKLHVIGAVTGKALSVFNETGDQALLTASSSGTTKFTVNNDGSFITHGISSTSNTTAGTTYYDSDDNLLKVYNGTSWVSTMSSGGGNVYDTLVVAASDSNSSSADYVANGTDDDVTIETAISALPSGGGKIILLEGTYSIGDSAGDGIDITKSNVTIEGQGKSTILQRAANTASSDAIITLGDGGTTAVSGITISNLTIDGARATYSSNFNYGIRAEDVTDSKIINNWIINHGSDGLYLKDSISSVSTHNIIDGNYFNNNFYTAIYFTGTSYNFITNNDFNSNGGVGYYGAIAIYNSDYNAISNNQFTDTTIDHIYVASVSTYNLISDNVFNNSTYDAISLDSDASHNVITGNVINEVGSSAGIKIDSDDNLISGNKISDTSGAIPGISLTSTSDSNYVSGNEITGAGISSKISDAGTNNTIQQEDRFNILGATNGLALLTLNETGDQALLTASASGTTKLSILHNGLLDATVGGLATYTKAGTIDDTDFSDTAVNGLMGFDSTNGRLYIRNGGSWSYIAKTAGFQIPDYEAFSFTFSTATDSATLGEFDSSKPLSAGDFLIPFVEKQMEDGALHGLYAKFSDIKGLLFADETSKLEDLEATINSISTATQSGTVNSDLFTSKEEATLLSQLVDEIKTSVDGLIIKFEELAESLTTKKIITDELCVSQDGIDEATCLTKDQVDQLIKLLPSPTPTSKPESSATSSSAPNFSPNVTPTPSPEPSTNPEATASAS